MIRIEEEFHAGYFIRLVASRTIKYSANALRPLFLLHHLFRPSKRYTLPHHAPAIFRSKSSRSIPRIVWQTNYTDRVTLAVYASFLMNRLMAPTFEYRFHNDEEMDRFVEENCSPETAAAFAKLQIGAARADFWRILVLLKHGGVYLDMDANFVWPPERFIRENDEHFFIFDRSGEVTNFLLASAPDNPVFERLESFLRDNIDAGKLGSVFDMTGPIAIGNCLADEPVEMHSFRNVCHQGQFTNPRLQYPDKGRMKWSSEQKLKSILRRDLGKADAE
ncbi:glycosyltransferase family 32 protein [Oricola sp.]|uniref:glycosyltransferase family 32 protein n=1 Tax=Oricola sp. TaxID=1979950 RepID=UPI000C8F1824|nr:mannosyltransferase [Ahrensia sp.]